MPLGLSSRLHGSKIWNSFENSDYFYNFPADLTKKSFKRPHFSEKIKTNKSLKTFIYFKNNYPSFPSVQGGRYFWNLYIGKTELGFLEQWTRSTHSNRSFRRKMIWKATKQLNRINCATLLLSISKEHSSLCQRYSQRYQLLVLHGGCYHRPETGLAWTLDWICQIVSSKTQKTTPLECWRSNNQLRAS